MNKLWILLTCSALAFSQQITLAHAQKKALGKNISTNAKITQLSSQKQQIVSRLSGHIEIYYVTVGEKVKSGDKVVLIQSMELSKMSAEYLALTSQIKAAEHKAATARKLYKKGLTSRDELNTNIIALEEIRSKRNTLISQLDSLGIDTAMLSKPTDQFILRAHADGTVGELLAPLHSNVDAQTPILTLVSQNRYYALAYVSVNNALTLNAETRGWIHLGSQTYPCHFIQLMPEVDSETQRAQVLFIIEKDPGNLLLGAYTKIDIELPPKHPEVMVKKSALTLFKGEWVVFVPKDKHHDEDETHADKEYGHEKEEHEVHSEEKYDTHEKEAHLDEEDEHGHDADEEEVPYLPVVVEVINYYGNEAAVKGLKEETEYVSSGVYFIKSMILKSSLGEHGH